MAQLDLFSAEVSTDAQNVEAYVREFREKFDASKEPELWAKLVAEETSEVREAVAHLLKEIADLCYVVEGFFQVGGDPDALNNVGDDVAVWVGELLDIVPDEIIRESVRRVHLSNMSKLGADGKPIRREDGKVLKGPDYKPPYLVDLVSEA